MSKKEKTTGQEFKDTLKLIFKYRVNLKPNQDRAKYISVPKLREDYKKRGVTEEMFREQMPTIMPTISREDIDKLAQIIFRPTKDDLLRGN
ncbi:MAG: hypothetical protein FWE10_06005 [Rikenellaceae bacterium]|nr:hypothetical protein [Rikenellaceae bacterium]MCL2692959.1 hypothetical protein [Rikenellaceae bacterium]